MAPPATQRLVEWRRLVFLGVEVWVVGRRFRLGAGRPSACAACNAADASGIYAYAPVWCTVAMANLANLASLANLANLATGPTWPTWPT